MNLSFIGDLTVDNYPQQNKMQLGGASLTSALWAKKLGADATILAAVGGDKAGRKFKEYFKKIDLPLTFLKNLKSPTSKIDIFVDSKGERTFGDWQPGAYAKYHLGKKELDFLKTQDAVVLPLYYPTRHLLDELIKIKQSNPSNPSISSHPSVVIDFDDLSQFNRSPKIIQKHLKYIDIVKVGLDLDKDKILIKKLKSLRQPKKLILITLGPNGSMAFFGNQTFRQTAPKIQVKNSTGAGDAYIAGFMVEYTRSKNIKKSLELGTNTATKAIT